MPNRRKYLYLVVHCRACRTQAAVHYHGEADRKGEPDLSIIPPKSFEYRCQRCQASHRYTLSDIRVESFEFAPPPGGKDSF